MHPFLLSLQLKKNKSIVAVRIVTDVNMHRNTTPIGKKKDN